MGWQTSTGKYDKVAYLARTATLGFVNGGYWLGNANWPAQDVKKPTASGRLFEFGRSEWIRTTDPLHPMQMRYQAAPHSVQQEQNYNSSPAPAPAPRADLAGLIRNPNKTAT